MTLYLNCYLIENYLTHKGSIHPESTHTTEQDPSATLTYAATLRTSKNSCRLLFKNPSLCEIIPLGASTSPLHGNTNQKNSSSVIEEEVPNLVIAFDELTGSFNFQETSRSALIINESWTKDPIKSTLGKLDGLPGQIEIRDHIQNLKLSHNPCYLAVYVETQVPTLEGPNIHPKYQALSAELKTQIFVIEMLYLKSQ